VFEFDKLDNERIVNQIEQVKRREKWVHIEIM
jgi:hypothetical protein